jgi:predicted nuclease of predicted toxin-antitoxin system
VRILVDEQLPRQLVPYFIGHDVRTTQEQGWAGKKNGELLKLALADGFEVLVTGDKNLEFQQNLKNSGLFVVVLVAPSNKLEDLLPRIPGALAAIATGKPGEVVRIDA